MPAAAPLPADPAPPALLRLPLALLQRLFDTQPDIVFFAKDARGRYTHANQTLVDRLRLTSRAQLVGRRVDEVFAGALGQRFRAQDAQVLRDGREVIGQLELHLYPDRAPGWCLTHKLAWREAARGIARDARARSGAGANAGTDATQGEIVGLIGLSRDLAAPGPGHATPPATYARVAQVVDRLQHDYAEPLRLAALAREAGLSMSQLERLVVQLYRLTPRQLLARARLDAALALLAGDATIAEIAHACGYADHSAFTRQFRRGTGLSPRDYRALGR